jgi:hypothetical protein
LYKTTFIFFKFQSANSFVVCVHSVLT